jgi:hypothetical protein
MSAITARQKPHDSVDDLLWSTSESAFPDGQNTPLFVPELAAIPCVTRSVRSDLRRPVLFSRLGHAGQAACVTMPKAAM